MKMAMDKLRRRVVVLLIALLCVAGMAYFSASGSGFFPEPAAGEPTAREAVAEAQEEAAAERVPLPIIMYHSVLQDPQFAGQWTVTTATLEEDLHYLKKNGYTAISSHMLIAYAKGEGELPEKPIMLTFDDGYYNNMIYAEPLLKEYGMRAVVSPIGSKIEEFSLSGDHNPLYAYLSWEDLCEIAGRNVFEIGNHTYGLHRTDKGRNGASRKAGEDVEIFRQILMEDVGQVQHAMESHCGYAPKVFVFPFGKYDKEGREILRDMGFEVLLTCYGKVNYIERDPSCLLQLGRFNRSGTESTAAFMKKIVVE